LDDFESLLYQCSNCELLCHSQCASIESQYILSNRRLLCNKCIGDNSKLNYTLNNNYNINEIKHTIFDLQTGYRALNRKNKIVIDSIPQALSIWNKRYYNLKREYLTLINYWKSIYKKLNIINKSKLCM